MTSVEIIQEDDVIVVGEEDNVSVMLELGDQGPPGIQGPPGPASEVPGPPGPPGTAGKTILYGPTDPTFNIGTDGDFYINTSSHFMFGPKANGAWPAGFSLIGPAGNTVLYGVGAPAAATGKNGDFYIDTATAFIYGPKAAGAWPAGVSLIGPQGPKGDQGVKGDQGIQGPPGVKGDQGIQGYPGVGVSTVYYADSPPTGVPDGTMWWESDTGLLYIRFNDGTSSQWVIACPQPDISNFVMKSGDTMSGSLNIAAAFPAVNLNRTTSDPAAIASQRNGKARWTMQLGTGAAESTGNVGSDFALYRCDDAGVVIDSPLYINRKTGDVALTKSLSALSFTAYGTFASVLSPTTGVYYFGSSGNNFLNYDGAKFNLVGGALSVNGDIGSTGLINGYALQAQNGTAIHSTDIEIGVPGTAAAAFIDFHSGATANDFDARIISTGGTAAAGGSRLDLIASTVGASNMAVSILTATTGVTSNGYVCHAGFGGAYGGNSYNFQWTGVLTAWIDAVNIGVVSLTSDYRIKKDVLDLPSMWDTVKALRPIKYTQADFQPPAQAKFIEEEMLKSQKDAEDNPEVEPREISTAPMFAADDIERWGFIAHELQETLTPSAATGVKDAPDTVQSPNPFTVIAALTKALQEAMTRIEALEAAGVR